VIGVTVAIVGTRRPNQNGNENRCRHYCRAEVTSRFDRQYHR
jgi:hypothetical protein